MAAVADLVDRPEAANREQAGAVAWDAAGVPLVGWLHSFEAAQVTVSVEQIAAAAAVDVVDIYCPEALAGPEQVSSGSDNRSGVAAGIVFAVKAMILPGVKSELAAAAEIVFVAWAIILPGMRPEPAAEAVRL